MINEVSASGGRFGVVHDDEVRENVVGTSARVQRILHTYDDGRMDIVVSGEDRFRIREIIQDMPYLRVIADPVADTIQGGVPAKAAIDSMLDLYQQFIARLGLEPDQKEQLEGLMEEMEAERDISYVIGQTIGMDSNRQQALLSVTEPKRRIELLTGELKRHDTVHRLARGLFEEDDFDPTVN
jgi:ATP-dependent Lon protease